MLIQALLSAKKKEAKGKDNVIVLEDLKAQASGLKFEDTEAQTPVLPPPVEAPPVDLAVQSAAATAGEAGAAASGEGGSGKGKKEDKSNPSLFAATCLPPKDAVLARVLGQMMPQWIVGYHEADSLNEVETQLSAEEVAGRNSRYVIFCMCYLCHMCISLCYM